MIKPIRPLYIAITVDVINEGVIVVCLSPDYEEAKLSRGRLIESNLYDSPFRVFNIGDANFAVEFNVFLEDCKIVKSDRINVMKQLRSQLQEKMKP